MRSAKSERGEIAVFLIKRIADPRLSERICQSFGIDAPGAFAYGAFQNDNVLATAVFLTGQGGNVVLCGADTGRRMDIGLIDGMARAAFSAQLKCGARTGQLGDKLPDEARLALTKLGYGEREPFDLAAFFAKKACCGR